MLRLSKKIEYALIALQHTSQRRGEVCSVKEMAERYHISFELLAKVLSTLSKHSIVQSLQGVNGGFMMTKSPSEISIRAVINALEGEKSSIVECGDHESGQCSLEDGCTIKHPLM